MKDNINTDKNVRFKRHKDARWFNVLNPTMALEEDRWRKFTQKGLAFFFGDKIVHDYVTEMIQWELKRFAIRAERETEPSVRFFRQSFNAFTIWMELMNSHIHHGDCQRLTTVSSIIDKYGISRNTVKRILAQAIEAGWATEYQATEDCPCIHYEATEQCMLEFFKRVKRESTLFDDSFHQTSLAFQKLLDFEKYIEDKRHIG